RTAERVAASDAAPTPSSDAAPAAMPDAFAPLRKLGAEWRYDVEVRRGEKLEPLSGVSVVLRVAGVSVESDHALVTLVGRVDPPAAPPALVRQLAQPLRFMLLPDGLVELLPA